MSLPIRWSGSTHARSLRGSVEECEENHFRSRICCHCLRRDKSIRLSIFGAMEMSVVRRPRNQEVRKLVGGLEVAKTGRGRGRPAMRPPVTDAEAIERV